MDAVAFETHVKRTMNQALTEQEHLMVAVLGLSGESGEVADIIKKAIAKQDINGVNIGHLIEEMGDTLWCLALLASLYGYTLDEVAQRNIQKLNERYPQGWPTTTHE